MDDFPDEVLCIILKSLGRRDLLKCRFLNIRWSRLSTEQLRNSFLHPGTFGIHLRSEALLVKFISDFATCADHPCTRFSIDIRRTSNITLRLFSQYFGSWISSLYLHAHPEAGRHGRTFVKYDSSIEDNIKYMVMEKVGVLLTTTAKLTELDIHLPVELEPIGLPELHKLRRLSIAYAFTNPNLHPEGPCFLSELRDRSPALRHVTIPKYYEYEERPNLEEEPNQFVYTKLPFLLKLYSSYPITFCLDQIEFKPKEASKLQDLLVIQLPKVSVIRKTSFINRTPLRQVEFYLNIAKWLSLQGPCLVELGLDYWDGNAKLPCLPCLKILNIWYMESSVPEPFYRAQFPNLEELTIHGFQDDRIFSDCVFDKLKVLNILEDHSVYPTAVAHAIKNHKSWSIIFPYVQTLQLDLPIRLSHWAFALSTLRHLTLSLGPHGEWDALTGGASRNHEHPHENDQNPILEAGSHRPSSLGDLRNLQTLTISYCTLESVVAVVYMSRAGQLHFLGRLEFSISERRVSQRLQEYEVELRLMHGEVSIKPCRNYVIFGRHVPFQQF